LAGFTLVEVLVAVLLATIGFMGVFASYSTSLGIQLVMDDRAAALFRSQKILEETSNIQYDDLDAGTTVDYFYDPSGLNVFVTTTVQDVSDAEIAGLWTRFPDPDPTTHYKMITVDSTWGTGASTEDWETLSLNLLRVKRENTVEFDENASSQ